MPANINRITRNLTGLVCPSVRHELLYGIDHLVVPVVALIGDECYWPMDEPGYEFAPADVVQSSVWLWNNKPVLPIHPEADSANYVSILDQYAFGSVFNPQYVNSKLYIEAWMNSQRAHQLGGDCLSVYNRCEDGESVEVSIGISASVKAQSGVSSSGREYKSVWTGILPDHLAIGLAGKEGACSVERGCGTNRCLVSVPVNPFVTICSRSLAANTTDTLSDNDIRDLLQDYLYTIEPDAKFIWVNAVYDTTVIYSISKQDGGPDETFEREYTISADGKEVDMNKGRTEVVSKTIYEPKVAAQGNKADSFKALYADEKSGLSRRGLLQKISNLLFSNTDSPAEEEAELVQYRTIETLLGTLETFVSQAKSTVSSMISAEVTETPADEQDEETLEAAQLNSINNLCLSMYGVIAGVLDAVYQCNYGSSGSDMYYYESGEGKSGDTRKLKGAKISAANMKDIQSMHDTAQKLGAACDSSSANKTMASGDVPCGCHKSNTKGNGDDMKDEEVKGLATRALSGKLTVEDRKFLGMAEGDSATAATPAAVPATVSPTTPTATAADPKQLATGSTDAPTIDWTKVLPPDVVQYVQRMQLEAGAERNRYIAHLAANTKLTKAQLEAKTTEQLAELASVVESVTGFAAADYSGMGLGSGEDGSDTAGKDVYSNPPNPWDKDRAKANTAVKVS